MDSSVKIRSEKQSDYSAIQAVNESAFDTPAEAILVASLRKLASPIISLVAEVDSTVVGHIMFSPIEIDGKAEGKVMGLAPMAVIPQFQRQGIGSALVKAGLEECAKLDFGAVIVLGHPDFYPKFGFVPASQFLISSDYDVPDNVFMALELQQGYLAQFSGKVKYNKAFNDV